jgi:molybdate transport system ATP-binding protein
VKLTATIAVSRGTFELAADVTAAAHEVLVVLGPNGAGKSTLLRALAGLTPIDDGRIELGGRVLEDTGTRTRLTPAQRRIGVVFQDYRLFPHLNARDNVAFGLRTNGVSRSAARLTADEWLGRVGLTDVAARRPSTLSGGQAQRVAMARALAGNPSMMLLDEPLSALDAGTRATTRSDLRRHLTGFAGPSLVVTHDPLEALTLGDRIVVLEEGRVVQTGPVAEVARRPATPYVALLVGLNLYRGDVRDGLLYVDGGGVLEVPAGMPDGRTLATISPSAVTLHAHAPGRSSARNQWPVTIESLETVVDRVRVTLAGPPAIRADITAHSAAELRLRPGDRLWVSAKTVGVDTYPEPGLA